MSEWTGHVILGFNPDVSRYEQQRHSLGIYKSRTEAIIAGWHFAENIASQGIDCIRLEIKVVKIIPVDVSANGNP